MKRKAIVLASVSVAGICYWGTWWVLRAQGSLPTYAATFDIQQFGPTGSIVSTQTAVKGERSDGSHVWVRAVLDNRSIGIRSIVDIPSRKRVTVDPVTESVTTYKLTSAEAQHLSSPAQCASVVRGTREKILDFQAVQQNETITAGSRVITIQRWVAPALNCLALRSITDIVDDRELKAHIVEQASSIQLTPPDASLFAVPANYTERTPSQVFAEAARRKGQECTTCTSAASQQLDMAYRNRQ
ncbi:MAG TPA: hypothetical protein VKV15_00690 [Bryobacteraceae bacterium]|nr:hypothetical protein [Bryobacteraceae bacterium]